MSNFRDFLRQITTESLRTQFLCKTKVTRCPYLILETEIVRKRERKRNKERKRIRNKMRNKKRKNSTSLNKR